MASSDVGNFKKLTHFLFPVTVFNCFAVFFSFQGGNENL